MTPGEFIEVFDTIAEAPGGIERLRELVLQLAVRGRLVPQNANEEPASVLLERIADEKFRLFREGKLRIPKPVPPIATDEAPFDVPDHWEWVRLGDIANSRLGKMLDKSKNKGPYRRYLRNANVQWFRFDLSDVLELRLEDAELEEYSVKENDLIVCEGGEPGRAAVCGPDVDGMVFQKALHRVRPWCGISTWYLAYLLRCDTWSQRINTLFTGATIKHLTGKALATHMVPLSPLSEQYRIVSKVDELMGLIDRLVAARRSREAVRTAARDSALVALRNAATPEDGQAAWTRIAERMDDLFTAPADLAPLREAVLQLAVRGRLVPQDERDGEGEDLFFLLKKAQIKWKTARRIRKQKDDYTFSDRYVDTPKNWTWARLYEIGQTQTGTSPSSNNADLFGDYIPFIKPGNMGGVEINYDGSGLSKEGIKHSRFVPENSILMVCIGATLGKVNKTTQSVCFNQQINSLTTYLDIETLADYIMLALKSPSFQKLAWSKVGTGTLPIISKRKWEVLPIPLPPLAEQHRIVAKVEELMGLIDRLERHLGAREGIQADFSGAVCSFAQQGVGHV